MYYEYWGLHKAPFDNVPDPSMYVESHVSVETAVAETLFAIEEGDECIAVIVGEIGSGKTLSLRLILDSLDRERYRIALVTNPATTFVQLLRDVIGQITGRVCQANRKADLLEIFNKLIFETMDQGKKILIFIDEANALPPSDLESLRLLTNMQEDSRNMFTLVLAGQMELAKRLEHPRRANLFQRIGAYNRIEKLESTEMLKDYVMTRLRLAGGNEMIFTDACLPALWEHSEHGVPRLVNKICKLCLKAGETNGFREIGAEVVNLIGERFQRLARPAPHKQRPRPRRTGGRSGAPGLEARQPRVFLAQEESTAAGAIGHAAAAEADAERLPRAPEGQQPVEASWETDIGSAHIRIGIPADVLRQASTSSEEMKVKMAGALAAQTLQRYPQLVFSSSQDPVVLWSEIRTSILNVFEEGTEAAVR
ncbi:MAG: AAA family ATPase [Syntrophorhabdales bacterium]|jgi:type II secretory pathway predicted ATPase ExeA